MKVFREVLSVGLLAESNFLTLSYPRKILCAYDINNNRVAYDVINEEIEFPIYRPRRQKGYYVAFPILLNDILENLGYPELLEDVHIDRIMNEDFEKVFIETGYIMDLYNIAQDSMLPKYKANNYECLKNEFKIKDKEIKNKKRR